MAVNPGSTHGRRVSAFRSKGSGGSRANALWGKGGRGLLLLALLVAGLLVPGAAVAGGGDNGKGGGPAEGGRQQKDTTPPETSITGGPEAEQYHVGLSATFTFASDETGVSFECRANETRPFERCSGSASHTLTGLFPPAPTTFHVRAVDRAGNADPTPASRTFFPLPYLSRKDYPAGSLLGDAKANPYKELRIIVQSENRPLLRAIAAYSDQVRGKNKREFNVITALNAKLPGWAIVFIAEHEALFGQTIFTRDGLMRAADLAGGPRWQHSIRANRLYSRAPITCLTDPVTGVQVDPLCVADSGYVAPQAPAIAIVDSGVDPAAIADFGARLVHSQNFSTLPTSFPAGDGQGHGTLVAGIAASSSSLVQGAAPNAPIVSLRTSDDNGQSMVSDVIAAVDWIVANKAQYNIKVANFSMTTNEESSIRFDPLDRAVEKLWLNGVTVVAAAGNHGAPNAPVKLGAPANDPFVITVGALDQNGTENPSDDFRAPWSAYGHTADGFAKPDLSAPGRYMVGPVPTASTLAAALPDRVVAPGYMWMSGTSFSAPAVAGVAAQLLALRPTWGPDQVKGALLLTPTPLPNTTGAGFGEVDAYAASQVVNPPNPNENLYAFVSTDSESGLRTFDSEAWKTEVSNNASWSSASWSSASWSSASWSSASWSSASWSSASWSSASWSSSTTVH